MVSEEEIFSCLEKRRGILEGVCITGGEPTLEPDLKRFILRCRNLGYAVKLDTNGYRPETLEKLLREGLLDYVAMDIKASLSHYGEAAGCPNLDVEKIRESVRLLQSARVGYEFRTTVVKGIHTVEEFAQIGEMLAGSPLYYLQQFRDSGDILGYADASGKARKLSMGAFSRQEMEEMAALAGKYIDKVVLRGVE